MQTAVFAAAIILIIRHRRTKKCKLALNETFDLAFAILGGVSGSYLIYQSYDLYDWFCLNCGFYKIFQPLASC